MSINLDTEDFLETLAKIHQSVESTPMTPDEGYDLAYKLGKAVCFKGVDGGQLNRTFHAIYNGTIGSVFTPQAFHAISSLAGQTNARKWIKPRLKLSEIKATLNSCKDNEYALSLCYANFEALAAFKAVISGISAPDGLFEYSALLQSFCLAAAE